MNTSLSFSALYNTTEKIASAGGERVQKQPGMETRELSIQNIDKAPGACYNLLIQNRQLKEAKDRLSMKVKHVSSVGEAVFILREIVNEEVLTDA